MALVDVPLAVAVPRGPHQQPGEWGHAGRDTVGSPPPPPSSAAAFRDSTPNPARPRGRAPRHGASAAGLPRFPSVCPSVRLSGCLSIRPAALRWRPSRRRRHVPPRPGFTDRTLVFMPTPKLCHNVTGDLKPPFLTPEKTLRGLCRAAPCLSVPLPASAYPSLPQFPLPSSASPFSALVFPFLTQFPPLPRFPPPCLSFPLPLLSSPFLTQFPLL